MISEEQMDLYYSSLGLLFGEEGLEGGKKGGKAGGREREG